MKTKTSKRRAYSPITGKKYPKCSTSGCSNNVYAAGYCYGHQTSAPTSSQFQLGKPLLSNDGLPNTGSTHRE